MPALLLTLESNPLATWLRTSAWGYPLLEIAHLLGIGTVFGTMVLVDGLVVRGADAASARRILPVTWAGFGVAAASGALMFAARATDLGYNRALWAKLVLIAIAGLNAAWFHHRHGLQRRDGIARGQAALSLALWIAVVGAGRLIAYL